MNTRDKLLKAFDQFRPHINGHKTAMDLFFEAVNEVDDMQKQLSMSDIPVQSKKLMTRDEIAIHAMSAMISNFESDIHIDIEQGFGSVLSKAAYKMADEMLKHRSNEQNNN